MFSTQRRTERKRVGLKLGPGIRQEGGGVDTMMEKQ